MPIFARRRLRSMLDELSRHMDDAKGRDLRRRLEVQDTSMGLAAEAELAMLWAISRFAQLTVDPVLPGSSRRPDASSGNLFASAPAVIEIRALSDDSFSGKDAMDRTANIISAFADQLRKRAGRHLYFEFSERSYRTTRFHRERCVDPKFELTPHIEQQLRQWITAPDWPNPPSIRITDGKTDVVVSWQRSVSRYFRVHSRMPPVAYDLEDNPIFKALKKKAHQVRGAKADTLRCVFLVDAGCDLLRRLQPMSRLDEVGGEEIIDHALRKLGIDVVCVFSPYRRRQFGLTVESEIFWKVTCFDRRQGVPRSEYERLEALANELPRPKFEGYQARDLHRQGGFNPEGRGWYLPTIITTGGTGKMSIKISSRLVHEYLAGRIDATQFQRQAFGKEKNYFELELSRGNTIQGVQFESGGIDEDDDYLIFDLDFDWGAVALKSNGSSTD